MACYPCRFCKTHRNVCHTQILQDDNSLRNTINYNNDISINNVSITGINELCVWNQVNSFSVTSNYSVDIMHDLLEGVCAYDLGFILKEIIYNLKYFTIQTLNDRIESFNYGPTDIRSRPPLISEENLKRHGHLIMSASEMSCFVKYLGLIVGDMVPEHSGTLRN